MTERGSTLQGIATIREFFWERFGIYLIVKGFKPSPILSDNAGAAGAGSGSSPA